MCVKRYMSFAEILNLSPIQETRSEGAEVTEMQRIQECRNSRQFSWVKLRFVYENFQERCHVSSTLPAQTAKDIYRRVAVGYLDVYLNERYVTRQCLDASTAVPRGRSSVTVTVGV